MKPGEFYPEEDSSYIPELIRKGESGTLEFKFEIIDTKKIARTLVAFANTSGGTILIGVKDNGAIAGVRSDEEFYMVDAAASLHCKPQVEFSSKLHDIEGKIILEIIIEKSKDVLHTAPDKDGNHKVFIRKDDENLLPSGIFIKVFKKRLEEKGVTIEYSESERFLLRYLLKNDSITLSKFIKKANLPFHKAEKILINFILLDIIKMDITDKGHFYMLNDPEASQKIIDKISP